jgi:isopenicillin N synthase-like dioxygenase
MELAARFRTVLGACAMLLMSNIALATFDSTIPVIDMNDYYSQERHHIFIKGLSDALKQCGFVAVINSKVDKQTLDDAYDAAKEFYALPLETKKQYISTKLSGQRGYVQSETAKGEGAKDFKEFYHITRDYSAQIVAKHGYASNIWPKQGTFKPALQKLIRELDAYAIVIAEALAESIGEPKDFFSKMTSEGEYILRSIHYPANPPQNLIWAAAHTDIDLFTILPRATAEGLQVQGADGKWIDVVVPQNAFIINAGDMLQNITNGVYKSAVHRVVSNNPGKERYSMVAFIHARPNDKMDPLPKFIKQVGKQKFANATERELLNERLIDLGLSSPEALKEFAASGVIERLIDVGRASPTAMQALKEANLASPKVLATLQKLAKDKS